MNPDRTAEHERLTVVDRAEHGRYELRLDDAVVGFATYRLHDDVVTMPHVETVPEHRGKDFAAQLMRGALDDLRDRALKIRPLCPYADAYMRRHPDTADLRA